MEKVANRILDVIKGQTVRFNGTEIAYTVSMGAVSLQEGDNLESIFLGAILHFIKPRKLVETVFGE